MSMTGPEISILVSVLGVGLGLAVLLLRTTARLERSIDSDRDAADEDRQALQQSMDDFRKEMQKQTDAATRPLFELYPCDAQANPIGTPIPTSHLPDLEERPRLTEEQNYGHFALKCTSTGLWQWLIADDWHATLKES